MPSQCQRQLSIPVDSLQVKFKRFSKRHNVVKQQQLALLNLSFDTLTSGHEQYEHLLGVIGSTLDLDHFYLASV